MTITVAGSTPIPGSDVTLRARIGAIPVPGFANVSAAQVSGGALQGRMSATFNGVPGTMYVRFKSNYAGEGKAVSGGFPIAEPINNDTSGTFYEVASAANLVDGTTYTVMYYFQSAGGVQDPVGAGVYTTAPFTISTVAVAPTDILPSSITIALGAANGTQFAALSANVLGATFTEGSPLSALASIASDGDLTLTQVADTIGAYVFRATATTAGGSFSKDITLNVVDTGASSDLVADNTYSSWAAVKAQLAAWQANWNGTVPAGKTSSQDRVIALTGEYTEDVALNYQFLTAGRRRVTVRGAGTFSTTDSTCKTNGQINLEGSSGLTLTLMTVVKGDQAVRCGNTTDVTVDRVLVKGRASPSASPAPTGVTDGITVSGGLATRLTIKRCYVTWYGIGVNIQSNATDLLFEDNGVGYITNDGLRGGGGAVILRPVFRRNSLTGTVIAAAGTDYHEDMMQFRMCPVTDGLWEGNIGIKSVWAGGAEGVQQGIYFGDGTGASSGNRFRNNLFCTDNGSVKFSAAGSGTGSDVQYNTAATIQGANTGACGFGGTCDNNVAPVLTSTSSDNGAGPNGIRMIVGSPAVAADQGAYFTGTPALGANLSVFRPEIGSGWHWTDTTPKGCFALMQAIFDDDDSFINEGWPTASYLNAQYNGDAVIVTTYTGTFSADGANV